MSKEFSLTAVVPEGTRGTGVTHEELGRQYCRETGTRLRLRFDKYGVHYEFRDPNMGDEWQMGAGLIWQGSSEETLSAAYEVFYEDFVGCDENP